MASIWRYREALRLLVLRELQVRYSNSVLGVVWSLLNPLVMTAIFSIVFSVLMPQPVSAYPVFFLAALLPWNYFAQSLTSASMAIVTNGHLINRVYFPREILPVAIVLANGVNFLIALVPLLALILIYQIPLGPALLWLPVLVLIQTMLSVGLGLGLSALNTLYRDVQQIVDVAVLPLFFATPIVYNLDAVRNPALRELLLVANPMASLVSAYRAVIHAGATPDPGQLTATAVIAAAILILGWIVFRWLSPAFADEL
jgi:ABC-type polysaccharide/polyol phosphate export permease